MRTCPHPYDLQSFVDGALVPDEHARVREHLTNCESCASRVAELERLRWILSTRQVQVPDGLLESILDFLRAAVPVRRLSCREATEMASAYIDEELNEIERETLEAHLFACEACYREYVAMRTAAHAMREAPRMPASDALRDRILLAVADDAAIPEGVIAQIGPRRRGWQRVLAPAAAIAAVFLMTFGVMHVRNMPDEPQTPQVAALPAAPVEDTPGTDTSDLPPVDVAPEVEPTEAATPDETEPVVATPETLVAEAPTSGTTRPGRPAASEFNEPAPYRAASFDEPRRSSEPAIVTPHVVERSMTPVRPERPTPRRVIDIAPPTTSIASLPPTPPTTSHLKPAERTASSTRPAPSRPMDIRRPVSIATASVPRTGVTASRPLPVGTTIVPAGTPTSIMETGIASAPRLTRPAPRVPSAPKPAATPTHEDTSGMYAAGPNWVPTVEARETVYKGDSNAGEALDRLKTSINKRAARDRLMSETGAWNLTD